MSELNQTPPSDDGYSALIRALDPDLDPNSRSEEIKHDCVESIPAADQVLVQDVIPSFEIGGAVELALDQLKLTVKGQFELFRNDVTQACEQTVAKMTSQQQTEMEDATRKIQQLKELAAKLQLCYDRSEIRDQHRVIAMLLLANKWRAIRTVSHKFHRWLFMSQKLKRLQFMEVNYSVPIERRALKRRSLKLWKTSLLRIQKAKREELFKSQLDLVSRKLVATYEANLQAMRTELAEAKRQIAMLVQNKERMEREMKQAFLRSVSALNLEAMSMFNSKIGDSEAHAIQGENMEP